MRNQNIDSGDLCRGVMIYWFGFVFIFCLLVFLFAKLPAFLKFKYLTFKIIKTEKPSTCMFLKITRHIHKQSHQKYLLSTCCIPSTVGRATKDAEQYRTWSLPLKGVQSRWRQANEDTWRARR